MSKTDELIKKGLIQEKKEELKNAAVLIRSHWDSLYATYVLNKLHPEKHNIDDLRLLASNLFVEIESYGIFRSDLDELEGKR